MTVGCCCANTRCWAAPATLPLTLPSRLHCPPPACQYHHRRRPPVRRRYEKARKLKEHIGAIRSTYEKNWDARDRAERQVSPPPAGQAGKPGRWPVLQNQLGVPGVYNLLRPSDAAAPLCCHLPAHPHPVTLACPPTAAQMATALYFIDKLALRAGHEKDEDEADTVGCCTLKVGWRGGRGGSAGGPAAPPGCLFCGGRARQSPWRAHCAQALTCAMHSEFSFSPCPCRRHATCPASPPLLLPPGGQRGVHRAQQHQVRLPGQGLDPLRKYGRGARYGSGGVVCGGGRHRPIHPCALPSCPTSHHFSHCARC